MKKFFVFFSLMAFALVLVACKHSHQAAEEWSKDATNHWHVCTGCDEHLDAAEHAYGGWTVVTEATETTKGSEKHACTVCGYEETRETPVLSHTHTFADTWTSDETHHWHAATCSHTTEVSGKAAHTGGTATTEAKAVCQVCGTSYGDLATPPLEKAITHLTVNGSDIEETTFELNEETGMYEGTFILDSQWENVYFDIVYNDETTTRITSNNTTLTGTIVPGKSSGSSGNERLYADKDEQVASGTWYYAIAATTTYIVSYDPENNIFNIRTDKNVPPMAITLDADTDDWDEDILSTMVYSYDEEDRWMKHVGFIDDSWLYVYVQYAHRDTTGDLNVIIGGTHFGTIYGAGFNTSNIDFAVGDEYEDEDAMFIVTSYEFAIEIEKIRTFKSSAVLNSGVKIGIDICSSVSEHSYGFMIDNKPHMWGVAGYNSWDSSRNFLHTRDGLEHSHDVDATGKCKCCGYVRQEGEDVPVKQDPVVTFSITSGVDTKIKKGVDAAPTVTVTEGLDYTVHFEKNETKVADTFDQLTEQGTYSMVVDVTGNDQYNSVKKWVVFTLIIQEQPISHLVVNVDGTPGNTFEFNEETGLFEGSFTLSKVWSNVSFDIIYEDESTKRITSENSTMKGSIIPVKDRNTTTEVLYADTDEYVASGIYFYPAENKTTTYIVTYHPEDRVFTIKVDLPKTNISHLTVDGTGAQASFTLNEETGFYEGSFTLTSIWSNVYFDIVYTNNSKIRLTVGSTNFEGAIIPEKSNSSSGNEKLYADKYEQIGTGTWYYAISETTTYYVRYDSANNIMRLQTTPFVVVPEKLTPEVTFSIVSGASTTITKGEDPEPTVTVTEGLDYTVHFEKNEAKVADTFAELIEPGTYSMVVTVTGNAEYKDYSTWAVFTLVVPSDVEKLTPEVTFSFESGASTTITKGVDPEPTVTVTEGLDYTVRFEKNEVKVADTFAELTEAGTYSMVVTVTGNEEYNDHFTWAVFTLVIPEKEISHLTVNGNNIEESTFELNQQTGMFEGSFTLTREWTSVYFDIVYEDKSTKRITSDTVTMKGAIIPVKDRNTTTEVLYADTDDQIATGTYFYPVNKTTTYLVSYDPEENVFTIKVDLPKTNISHLTVNGDIEETTFELNETTGFYEGSFTLSSQWAKVYFDVVYNDNSTRRLTVGSTTFEGAIIPEKLNSSSGNEKLFADQYNQIGTGTWYYAISETTTYYVQYDSVNNIMRLSTTEFVVVPERVISHLTVNGTGAQGTFTLNQETGMYEGSFTLTEIWKNVYFDIVYNDESTKRITSNNTTLIGSIIPGRSNGSSGNEKLYADQDNQVETGTWYYGIDGTTTYNVSYDPEENVFTIVADLD